MTDPGSQPRSDTRPPPDARPPHLAPDSPTELVEGPEGELVERLSGGTATLLLVWLIGIGAFSALLGAWALAWLITGERLGLGALFSGFGLYVALGGASGPTVLWLAGRAQDHSLGWFMLTAAKIGLVMIAIVVLVLAGSAFILAGVLPGAGALVAVAFAVVMTLLLSVIWALATWSADRWIARARLDEEAPEEGG